MLVSSQERVWNSFCILLAQIFLAKVCADLTWLTSVHNHSEAQRKSLRMQTFTAMEKMQVPWSLAERVLAFQSYVATVHREEDLSQPVFTGLSDNLHQELRLCVYRKLVLRAPFLRNQPKEVISIIVDSLDDVVFLPADFVLRRGDTGRELFFMRRGEAGVFVDISAPVWGASQEVLCYTAGSYFGEIGMVTGTPRKAWIMSKTYSVCSVMPYAAVETLSQKHPGSFTALVQSMVEMFKLKGSMQWSDVLAKLFARSRMKTKEEAFQWMCEQGDPASANAGLDEHEDDGLSAEAFEKSMSMLKVPELDRMLFWAQLDSDNNGIVSYDEFVETVDVDDDAVLTKSKSSLGRIRTVTSGGSDSMPALGMTSPISSTGSAAPVQYSSEKEKPPIQYSSERRPDRTLTGDTCVSVGQQDVSQSPSTIRPQRGNQRAKTRLPTKDKTQTASSAQTTQLLVQIREELRDAHGDMTTFGVEANAKIGRLRSEIRDLWSEVGVAKYQSIS